jgi:hypothetical protein
VRQIKARAKRKPMNLKDARRHHDRVPPGARATRRYQTLQALSAARRSLLPEVADLDAAQAK